MITALRSHPTASLNGRAELRGASVAKSFNSLQFITLEYGMMRQLKPQDLLVLFNRAANPDQSWGLMPAWATR
jgi:hypothetical protein